MKCARFCLLFVPTLLAVTAAGICFGGTALPIEDIAAFFLGNADSTTDAIIRHIRLPRVLAGVLAGTGLGVSGVLLQTVTSNALASPNLIGINSGAGLAVIVTLSLFPQFAAMLPLGAFFGALAAASLVLLASRRFGGSHSVIVLMGIALTTVFNAVISFFSLLDEGILAEYNHFTVGSLNGLRMNDLLLPCVLIALSFVGALLLSGQLGVLCMGDSAAAALGIRVKRLRVMALVCAAASAAAVVSFAGLLGFVGLLVPHMAKAQVGQYPKPVLIASAILGATVVVLADLLGRTLFAPSELPVGIIMSLIGAPYFLILLCRRKRYAAVS